MNRGVLAVAAFLTSFVASANLAPPCKGTDCKKQPEIVLTSVTVTTTAKDGGK